MNTENTTQDSYQPNEASSLIRQEIERLAKEKAEADALQMKLRKAAEVDQHEENMKEQSKKILQESEEFLGSKSSIRKLSKLSDFDEVTVAALTNVLKGKYTAEQINDYVSKQNDFNKFHKDNYSGNGGLTKFAMDISDDMKGFVSQTEKTTESEVEQEQPRKNVSKIDSNIHPEKVSNGNFVPKTTQTYRSAEKDGVNESERILREAGISFGN